MARLNQLRPDVLVAYASMIRVLAGEQLAGRLRIAPRGVNSSSEVLTAEARADATRAWNVAPFNVYAATETGGVAAECAHHTGMHLSEDLVIPEVVDDAYRPVPPGESGDRLLVTVLFSRTVPLIRYEMTDRVRLATRACPCGLPFRLLEAVEGRTDDMLELPGRDGGTTAIHPVVFHRVLDLIDAAGWQVRQHDGQLEVRVAGTAPGFDPAAPNELFRPRWPRPTRRPAGKRPLIVAKHGSDPKTMPSTDSPAGPSGTA